MQKQKPQTFNSGVCTIYSLANIAPSGHKPIEGLTAKTDVLRYKERTVGMSRFFTASQAHVRVDKLIRLPKMLEVSPQDIAITETGSQYKIIQIQYPEDVYPAVMDLTLEKVVAKYDIG